MRSESASADSLRRSPGSCAAAGTAPGGARPDRSRRRPGSLTRPPSIPVAGRWALAGHTYSFRTLTLERALDELSALGFELVEVWIGHANRGPEHVQRALAERGLSAAAVGAGGFYSAADEPNAALELAEAIGAPVVVACLAPELVDRIAPAFGGGVALCVENHWDQLGRSAEVQDVLHRGPRLAACLDTGHALLAGERPERFARSLGPALRHVHLKDARLPTLRERLLGRRARRRLLPRPEPVFPGRGALDVVRLRAALTECGFDGCLTLEHEGPDAATALAELRRMWSSAG
jgi:inosose dehydratase